MQSEILSLTYLNYLILGFVFDENSYEYYKRYSVINIDEDDIPEILYDSGVTAGGMFLLSYIDGRVVQNHLPMGSLYYLEGENRCRIDTGRMDQYSDYIFHLENGVLVKDIGGTYGALGFSDEYKNEDGTWIYGYEWDDKKVTEEEYKTLLENEFSKEQGTAVVGQYNKEEIMSILSSEVVR